jgi:O-antigen ligase
MAPNPVFGTGFESFWTGSRMQELWDLFPNTHINESHNGYIEVYLNLGVIGLGLLAAMFIQGYRTCVAAFGIDANSASLMLAYLLVATIYSCTEAGFRMLYYTWSFLLLFIMAAGCIRQGITETRSARAAIRFGVSRKREVCLSQESVLRTAVV